MTIEEEIFKKSKPIKQKLIKYGFKKENNTYLIEKTFMNDSFKAILTIEKENIKGKIIDLEFNEEYTNIRVENSQGEFVNKVKNEYKKILQDIKNNCFENKYFTGNQANRITKYILNKYNDKPEFLWEKYEDFGVFRNQINKKWYAIIMNINKSVLKEKDNKQIDILNVKTDEKIIEKLIKEKGYYKAYHMNKKNWITIALDETLKDSVIEKLIDSSYNEINEKNEWIVPANPKYYDIVNSFNDTDTIIWKQSSNINKNDIVYIYVAAPFSQIMFKCKAEEVNIPFEYKDQNVSMKSIVKLKLIKKYKKDQITFKKLNELGITSIRGPRKVSKTVSKQF